LVVPWLYHCKRVESTVARGEHHRQVAAQDVISVAAVDHRAPDAYHIPEGCLFVYDPLDRSVKRERTEIATTEIAPSILRNFGAAVPDYMPKPATLVA
jgi:hypothetical protein